MIRNYVILHVETRRVENSVNVIHGKISHNSNRMEIKKNEISKKSVYFVHSRRNLQLRLTIKN